MILTNKYNLPEQIVNAVKSDYDNNGTYSATTLIKDPKEILLFERHEHEIEEDVSERIYALLGTSVHYILEKNDEGDNQFKEERLYYKIGNHTISGKFDLYDMNEEKVIDFKNTSVWTYLLDDTHKYWQQLLTYAFILEKNGLPCKSGRIVQIFRDWSKTKSKVTKGYPIAPVNVINFKFYKKDFDYIENYIKEKLEEIDKYRNMPDDAIPACSKENRWATDDKYAVMKNGRKSALRVLNSMEEAEKWMKENGGTYIEKRNAESKKCMEYCQCNRFCNFWKENYGS